MVSMIGDRFVRSSFDDLMYDALTDLEHPDYVCSPRGQEIKEILVPRLCLTNPRDRVLKFKSRKINHGFAIGEFLWYWSGANDLETMLYYNKRMSAFSDDGETLNSAYGHRMRTEVVGIQGIDKSLQYHSQWTICKETLVRDKDSRRALMLINRAADQSQATLQSSKDVPCTLSLQFLIRDNQLHLHVNMRSNDLIWGATYDLFSFTMLQECMMLELRDEYPDLQLGRYYHTAGSLHLYKRHYTLAKQMLTEHRSGAIVSEPMGPLADLEELDVLMDIELELRERGRSPFVIRMTKELKSDSSMWMALELIKHREKRDEE